MNKVSVYDCSFVELPKITVGERQGNLTPVYNSEQIPFDVKRVFYTYDIPGGEARGAHAHKECHQFLIAASGAFEVVLDDGKNKRTVLLNRPFYGLHIPPGIWASEQGFSSGAICLVLASHGYEADDYIRDYDDFKKCKMILPSDFKLEKYGLKCRFVEEQDAEFILKLRTDPVLSRYLHATDSDVQKQKEWIHEYKEREKNGEDYYFIFFQEGKPVGLNRVYNIHGTTFTTGSWVFSKDALFESSIAASIMIRELCFEQMGFELEDGYDGVHVDNKQVFKFNKMIGLKESRRYMNEDGEFIAMQMTKEDFEKNKPKLLKYIGF